MQTCGHILPPFRAQINGRMLLLLYVCVCLLRKHFVSLCLVLFRYDLSRVLEMGPDSFSSPWFGYHQAQMTHRNFTPVFRGRILEVKEDVKTVGFHSLMAEMRRRKEET